MSWPPYLPSESDLLVNVSVRIQFRKQKPLSVLSDTLIKCQDLDVSQIIGRPGGRASALPVMPPLEPKTLARLQFVGEAASTAATPAIGEWLLHTLGVDSGHCPLTPRNLESGHWKVDTGTVWSKISMALLPHLFLSFRSLRNACEYVESNSYPASWLHGGLGNVVFS